jgi:hypothetical protein
MEPLYTRGIFKKIKYLKRKYLKYLELDNEEMETVIKKMSCSKPNERLEKKFR